MANHQSDLGEAFSKLNDQFEIKMSGRMYVTLAEGDWYSKCRDELSIFLPPF